MQFSIEIFFNSLCCQGVPNGCNASVSNLYEGIPNQLQTTITWQGQNAVSYDVYLSGQLLGNTTNLFYTIYFNGPGLVDVMVLPRCTSGTGTAQTISIDVPAPGVGGPNEPSLTYWGLAPVPAQIPNSFADVQNTQGVSNALFVNDEDILADFTAPLSVEYYGWVLVPVAQAVKNFWQKAATVQTFRLSDHRIWSYAGTSSDGLFSVYKADPKILGYTLRLFI